MISRHDITRGWSGVERAKFSLDVVSLLVSTAMTVGIFSVGIKLDDRKQAESQKQKDDEIHQSAQQHIDDKRIALWDKMGPDLDLIESYITYVGDWNHHTPQEIVDAKRRADGIFYTYSPFFSEKFSESYRAFMDASFETYRGMGQDAGIRSSPDFRSRANRSAFSATYDLKRTYETYNTLLNAAGDDFGLNYRPPAFVNHAPVPAQPEGRNSPS